MNVSEWLNMDKEELKELTQQQAYLIADLKATNTKLDSALRYISDTVFNKNKTKDEIIKDIQRVYF